MTNFNPKPNQITRETIETIIKLIPNLDVLKKNKLGYVLYDENYDKTIIANFLEEMNPERLAKKILISPDLPKEYSINKKELTEYLWNACDRNCFITLNKICIVWSDEDTEDTLLKNLYDEYFDEAALYMAEGLLGQCWTERSITIINMAEIVKVSKEISEENSDLVDPFFRFKDQLIMGLLTTTIHELRHLQMDTNIFLPEDEYPYELAEEPAVEEYCREVYENNYVPGKLLLF